MSQGKQRNRGIKNDLKGDPDFDLDSYIDENSREDSSLFQEPLETEEINSSNTKNLILIAATILFAIWWFDNDWNPLNNFTGLSGGEDNVTQVTEGTDGGISINIPVIRIPPINVDIPDAPTAPPAPLSMPLSEYITDLQNLGLLEDKISTFSARQVYDGGVPISYLQELNQAGLLEDLSFVYINSYFQNGTPISYLQELQEAGVYDGLSFVYVNSFYENGVSTEYLQRLDETGYLDELSFVYINSYYEAGVTPEFLDRLKEQGIYDDLSFLDVVDLYQREGN
ncbi:hypothetical protein AB2B38_000060 [Balneola sp. MJW-20]|uniref:hypothetical protein n=1 Tax=Gracilimonas aurantiaca TaxID=3234185 RepID=UPI0034660106